jgi:hypothetical protein
MTPLPYLHVLGKSLHGKNYAWAPNSALQRAGTHKVLGRGRPSVIVLCGRWRARVLLAPRHAAELGS